MNEKFIYQFDDNTHIMFKSMFGEISLENIYASWNYAIDNKIIPAETIGFITDFREATFNFDVREYQKVIGYFKQNTEIFKNRKIAAVTQSPKDVILPTFIEAKEEEYLCKPFYTLEAAVQWVLR